jgi:dolichyl-phosphate beta-glucosyltransferase
MYAAATTAPFIVADMKKPGAAEPALQADPVAVAAQLQGDAYSAYLHWKNEPLQGRPYLSIVIPAYNESERIVPTIGAIAAYVCGLGKPWELLIADDGSKDDTVSLCNGLELANLRVLQAPQNGGKGSAVRRGMLAAAGAVVLFADADNSTPIEELGPCWRRSTRAMTWWSARAQPMARRKRTVLCCAAR